MFQDPSYMMNQSYGSNFGGSDSSYEGGSNYGFVPEQGSLTTFNNFTGGNVGGTDYGFGGGMNIGGLGGGLGGLPRGGGRGGFGPGARGSNRGAGRMRGTSGPSRGAGSLGRGGSTSQNRGAGRFGGGTPGRGAFGGSRGRGAGRGASGGAKGSTSSSVNTNNESGYLQDHPGHFPDEYWCKMCNAKTTGPGNYRAHINGLRHKQNVLNLQTGESLVKTGPQQRKRKLEGETSERKVLDDLLPSALEPVVGLEYVTEIIREGDDSSPDYHCELCDCRTLQGNILYHLIGYRHRIAYINKEKPDVGKILDKLKSEDVEDIPTEKPDGIAYTPAEMEVNRQRARRNKVNSKIKELIPEIAASCADKKHKVKKVKINLPLMSSSAPQKQASILGGTSTKGRGGTVTGRGGAMGGHGGTATVRGGAMGGRGGAMGGRGGAMGGRGGAMGGRGGITAGHRGTMGGRGGTMGGRGGNMGGRRETMGGHGGAMGGHRGAMGGYGGAMGGNGTFGGDSFGVSGSSGMGPLTLGGLGDFSKGPGNHFGESTGFGPSAPLPGRTGMGFELEEDFGDVYGPRGLGRGPAADRYDDLLEVGGGYDLPPKRESDREMIRSEILETLKEDSLVSDAFILREFERRFGGAVKRARIDPYDNFSHDYPPSQTHDPLHSDVTRLDLPRSYLDAPRGRGLLPPPPSRPFAGREPGFSRL